MDNTEEYCKHHRIQRNCYSCHIEYTHQKTEMDTLHEKISELMVRISKLEEYKRLQDDLNKITDAQLLNLHEHRKSQIDENRAVSKHLTDLDESYQGLSAELSYILEKTTKTSGLTFEQAISAFKTGKKIRYRDGIALSCVYEARSNCGYGFELDHIQRDHWEIVDG